jgi:hypothetical protein
MPKKSASVNTAPAPIGARLTTEQAAALIEAAVGASVLEQLRKLRDQRTGAAA